VNVSSQSKKNSRNGFSLLELMGALSIFCILIALTLPSFRNLLSQRNLRGSVSTVTQHMILARQRAITESNEYIVEFDFANGFFTVMDDDNSNGLHDVGEDLLGPLDIAADVTMQNGPDSAIPAGKLTFLPNGSASSTGQVTLNDLKGRTKEVWVYRSTGQVSIR
jgi:prepilin-type N-terminal cleavage/methylation domain-containing protein